MPQTAAAQNSCLAGAGADGRMAAGGGRRTDEASSSQCENKGNSGGDGARSAGEGEAGNSTATSPLEWLRRIARGRRRAAELGRHDAVDRTDTVSPGSAQAAAGMSRRLESGSNQSVP